MVAVDVRVVGCDIGGAMNGVTGDLFPQNLPNHRVVKDFFVSQGKNSLPRTRSLLFPLVVVLLSS